MRDDIIARRLCFSPEYPVNILFEPWVKVVVLVCTLGILSAGITGLINLKMEFKPEWLMDPQSESKCPFYFFSHPQTFLALFPPKVAETPSMIPSPSPPPLFLWRYICIRICSWITLRTLFNVGNISNLFHINK